MLAEISNHFSKLPNPSHFMTIDEPTIGNVHAIMSELQCIAGGTTVVQETEYLDKEGKPEKREHLLIRNTGCPSDMGLPDDQLVYSVIDFYKPSPTPSGDRDIDTSGWTPVSQEALEKYEDSLGKDVIKSTLVHLAEGRTGFLSPIFRPDMNHADSYTSSEFEQFINDISGYDISQVIDTKPGIIHGCGINADDNRTIEFLKTYKISVLWAPVSNLLLYKDTLQISKLLSNGINVVLGSDWSPSGSKHVWEEAKFARFFAQEEDPSITDLDIYQMVTLNAANCIGPVKVGAIREGYMGDFFILRRDDINQEPLEAFFSCNDTNVRGVIVNGRIVYGDEDFMSPYGFDYQHFPIDEGEAAANKVVSIPSELKFRMIRDVCRIEALLKEVPPYWDRSRFLSTDDTYYLDRIQDLKRFIITTFSLK